MSDETPTDGRQLTTDSDRVREWADAHDLVPVSDRGGDGPSYTLADRQDVGAGHDEHTWEEFATAFDDDAFVFVYQDPPTGEATPDFEFASRDRAFERVGLGRDEFEDALRQGETVTTEIVETQVVETEVVERDTIESEVVDTETIDRSVVDSEVVERDVVETEFIDDEIIELTVDERRLDTIEEIEHYTIESEVVDVDIDQHDELERETTETTMDVEQVQRSILESDVLRSGATPDVVLEQDVIQSNRTEGDTVETELVERRLLETDRDETRRLRFVLESDEVLTTAVVDTELLDAELVDIDEYEAGEPIATDQADSDMARTESETGADADGEIELSPDDQGKDVIDQRGETVGIITEVEDQTAYIDPQPGLTDRLRARLNWGRHDDETYPIQPAQITELRDDAIVIRGEESSDGNR